jgi:hypothetical protein
MVSSASATWPGGEVCLLVACLQDLSPLQGEQQRVRGPEDQDGGGGQPDDRDQGGVRRLRAGQRH